MNRFGIDNQIAPLAQQDQLVLTGGPPTAIPSLRHGGVRGAPSSVVDDTGIRLRILSYWRMVRRWLWLVLLITIVVVCLAMSLALLRIPIYTASVKLQINEMPSRVVESGHVAPERSGSIRELRTFHQILKSRLIAERVVSSLDLAENESFLTAHRHSRLQSLFEWLPGANRPRLPARDELRKSTAVTIIIDNRRVRPSPGARLVDVEFRDPNPELAARIANAYAQALIDGNLQQRANTSAFAKRFLEDRLQQLRSQLKTSEKSLLDFAQREEILDVYDRETTAEASLASATSELDRLVSNRLKSEQQWKQVAQTDAIHIPQFLANGTVGKMRARRNSLMREYREKLATFKPSYPAMVQIRNKIAETNRQIAKEVDLIRGTLKAAFTASAQQESDMIARVKFLRAEVLALQRRSIQYNVLKREVETNRKLYNDLLRRYKEVEIAAGVGADKAFVVDYARVPTHPSSPQIGQTVLLAVVFGLVLGLAVSSLLEIMDDRFHTPKDVEDGLGLNVLGVIPNVKGGAVDHDILNLRSASTDAYRSLATTLQLSHRQDGGQSICVASAGPAEGKSITALAVARILAKRGLKVLLIDADLRHPSLHTKLDIRNSEGLTDYLAGMRAPGEIAQATDLPSLAFIARGRLRANTSKLLTGDGLANLLTTAQSVFDFIIVDGPPVTGLADAQLLANAADATLLLVRQRGKPKAVPYARLTSVCDCPMELSSALQ